MPLRIAQTGDIHVEQDRYFTDTVQCLEWFVEDAIRANTNLFVVNGDLTTCKQTIQERNLWVDTLIQMGNHAPVVLVAGTLGNRNRTSVRRCAGSNHFTTNVDPGCCDATSDVWYVSRRSAASQGFTQVIDRRHFFGSARAVPELRVSRALPGMKGP